MASGSVAVADRPASRLSARWADYVELSKPRIAALELVVVATASFVARWGAPNLAVLGWTLLGTLLVASSAGAMNQLLERAPDGLMRRTAGRPLPAGRLRASEVLQFAFLGLVAGLACLAWGANATSAVVGLATWLLYVFVYTPLKGLSAANTTVGAIAGAMPMLIGWTAAGGSLDPAADPRGWAMFLILFLWQFPHFMAIAWMYRSEYARAGFRMLTVVDPSGRQAALQAVTTTLALIPVSLVPASLSAGPGVWLHLGLTAALGAGMLAAALWFAVRRDDRSARLLLRASLVYLPLVLGCLVLATIE